MTNTKLRELVDKNNFTELITAELYALIDEEIEKGDEMDCELIDELVNAIESLENAETEKKTALILPLIFNDSSALAKRVKNKVNGRKTFMRLTAIAAAVAIVLSSANSIPATSGESVLVYAVNEFLEDIGEVFGLESFIRTNNTDTSKETTTSTNEEIEEQNNNETSENQNQMVSINLITYGKFKTSYLWKEELDLTGLKVVAVYSDDTEKVIPVSDCEISGFNSLKLGEQLITVKHNGLFAYFKVTVSKTEQNNAETRKITNIECNATGKDIVVPKGTENPAALKKVKYRYVYSDGTFSPWTLCKDAELISKYDSELIDTPQALTYRTPEGWEFTVNVIVYDNTVPEELGVIRLEVSEIPKAMQYYPTNLYKCYTYVNEKVDFTQFELKVTYEDGSFKHKTLADSKIKAYGTMTTDRPSPYKGYTITFAYGDATIDFKYDVLIKPEIQAWFVDETRWDVYYVNDAPAEYPASQLVTASMTDSNERIYLDVEVKGYDPNKIGYIELEIYYNGEKLCDYLGGFIYGDTGFAVTSRPVTEIASFADEVDYKPYVVANKCVGDGKLETYADIKYQLDDNPVDDPNQYFQSTASDHLRAMGIASYSVRCVDHAVVEYKIRADKKITELGTYESEVYLYNVTVIDNGPYNLPAYRRDGIVQDLSYTITIKEKPSYYEIDAPNNIKINIQDIYSEFYDKLHVYAVYKDGRKEEIFDYNVTRFSPSKETTSERLNIFIRYPSGQGMYKQVYVYSDGYEDSFFITTRDARPEKDNYYAVGESKPNIEIVFSSAKQENLYSLYTNYGFESDKEKWDIEGWDTSTPGEKEATIIYHSPIGDMKTTYKYVVIPEYIDPYCSVVFTDDKPYDARQKLEGREYKVYHIDVVGRVHEITDYEIIGYSEFKIPFISYIAPGEKRKDSYEAHINKIVGAFENPQVSKLEDGSYKVTIDCQYPPENGTMIYEITYRTKVGKRVMTRAIETSSLETIINESLYFENGNSNIRITAYIHNDGDSSVIQHKVCYMAINVPLE